MMMTVIVGGWWPSGDGHGVGDSSGEDNDGDYDGTNDDDDGDGGGFGGYGFAKTEFEGLLRLLSDMLPGVCSHRPWAVHGGQ